MIENSAITNELFDTVLPIDCMIPAGRDDRIAQPINERLRRKNFPLLPFIMAFDSSMH